MADKWKLSYLPLFYDDLNEAVTYISDVLENPKAANDLLNDVEEAILKRLPEADEFPEYRTSRKRPLPYYTIRIRNFSVFYVVIEAGEEKIMEVRRFLYRKRDIEKLI